MAPDATAVQNNAAGLREAHFRKIIVKSRPTSLTFSEELVSAKYCVVNTINHKIYCNLQ